ncbi:hypothetical protein Patl1_21207 [Pistacia atlantica]|uniref:Uncharacterized protein n=1 Tax=Pistacia atlantica TaxID=434234 RepID=A0ACC1BMH6_9ROSI|nr:hypothetical protein Patl1_21207 [Pistacia atlantica]
MKPDEQWLFLVFTVFSLAFFSIVDSDLASDRAALVALRSAVGGRSLLWNLSGSPCNWVGVFCTQDRVTELRLPGMGLSGQLPVAIGNLSQLQSLSLRYNALHGRKKSDNKTTSSKDIAPASATVKQTEIEIPREKTSVSSENTSTDLSGAVKAEAKSSGDKNLVFFGKGAKVFDLEDLLRASAEVLGKGTFGTAYKATLEMGLVVAVKRLKDVTVTEKEFREKMEVVGAMDHENLVPLRAYYFSRDEKLLVYDYLPVGSLSALLHGHVDSWSVIISALCLFFYLSLTSIMRVCAFVSNCMFKGLAPVFLPFTERQLFSEPICYVYGSQIFSFLGVTRFQGNRGGGRTPLNWETRSNIALGAARAITYIHTHGPVISHGNIKSSNILLSKSYEARVSDFGLAHLASPSSTPNRIDGYRAPEVTDARKVSQKADVYSFGVLLLELLTGKAPTQALLNEEGVDLPRWVQSIVKEEWTSEVFDLELLRYQNVEEDMVQLLQLAINCTVQYPDKRPSMTEVTGQIEEICHSSLQPEPDTDRGLIHDLEDGSSQQAYSLDSGAPPPSVKDV